MRSSMCHGETNKKNNYIVAITSIFDPKEFRVVSFVCRTNKITPFWGRGLFGNVVFVKIWVVAPDFNGPLHFNHLVFHIPQL